MDNPTIEELKKEVDEVYLLGFSVGASLSVHTAFKRENYGNCFYSKCSTYEQMAPKEPL